MHQDLPVEIIKLLGIIIGAAASTIALIFARRALGATQEGNLVIAKARDETANLRIEVNHRLTEMLAMASELGLAQGRANAQAQAQAQGLAQGLAQGHAQAEGLAEGQAQGLAQGRSEGRPVLPPSEPESG